MVEQIRTTANKLRKPVKVAAPGYRPSSPSSDTTVGRILQQARQRRNESIEAVVAELKIPRRHLVALEEGNLAVFPAEIYARGAFAKYATYLGVATADTNHAFMRVLSDAREFIPLRVHTPRPWLVAMLTPRWVLAGAIAIIALSFGGYIVWQVSSFVRLPALAVIEPAAGVVDASSITVSGKAAVDAEVFVNGDQVLMNAAGEFSQELSLHAGINVVRVDATNAAGRTRTIQRDILRPRN